VIEATTVAKGRNIRLTTPTVESFLVDVDFAAIRDTSHGNPKSVSFLWERPLRYLARLPISVNAPIVESMAYIEMLLEFGFAT
jgi:hypothetical protein